MREVAGVLLVFLGIVLGLYIGGWVMFIGGIAGLIEIIQSNNFESMDIAKNVGKIVLASVVGGAVAQLLIIPGYLMIFKEL